MPIVEVSSLHKAYGRVEALQGLDMTVEEGNTYGFLGRNGAGKSTSLRILMGITLPSSGTVRLFGQSIHGHHIRLRQRIGYVAQEQVFYGWMTPIDIGRFVGGFYPTWDPDHYARLVEAMQLPTDRKLLTFSAGMKAKLALSLALAHRPPLLLLDEPTAGLDPVARREFFEILDDQGRAEGHTTLFSSHLVDEVERVANRIGIIENGTMRYEGSVSALTASIRSLRRPEEAEACELPPGLTVLKDRLRRGFRQVTVRSDDAQLLDSLAADWTVDRLPLEDIFVEMVTR
ncbi:MAG: ABC transporter ATP-binding protein [Armatimonadetes bacterium]|nr:ABC transporter ATP-binding protein [Armatimonadota bacterium]